MCSLQRRLAFAGLHGSAYLCRIPDAEVILPVIGFVPAVIFLGWTKGLVFGVMGAIVGYLTPSSGARPAHQAPAEANPERPARRARSDDRVYRGGSGARRSRAEVRGGAPRGPPGLAQELRCQCRNAEPGNLV